MTLTLPLTPQIHPEIFALRPDFTALSIHVRGGRNAVSDADSAALLAAACAEVEGNDPAAAWAEAHLEAWREAFRGFGAKPKKTMSSAEALRKRALKDGGMPVLNAVVDLYNAISLRYALPIGGEDLAGYQGQPRLWRAEGSEGFQTMAGGEPVTEAVEPGEVVWGDEAGVTCRRWNWRQGSRTRITEGSSEMWFLLERLEPMPVAALVAAGAELVAGLRRLSPGLTVEALLLDAQGARVPSLG